MDDDESEDAEVRLTDLFDQQHCMRVQRRWCGTCIGWKENRMFLAPGRKDAMFAAAVAANSFVPCHQTLPCGQYDAPPAVCRAYWDHAKDRVWTLRYAAGMDAVVYVEPPSTTWNNKEHQ